MLNHITPHHVRMSAYVIPGLKGKTIHSNKDVILDAVCNYYDIVFDVLKKRDRYQKTVERRQVAMYLLCYYTNMSLKSIGQLLGYDHTTVIHSRDQINKLLCTDEDLAYTVMRIKEKAQLLDKVPPKPIHHEQ